MNKKFILTVLAFVLSLTSWAETKINGIYYELDASSKTASVTSGDYQYSGEVTIPSTVSYEDVTYSVTSIGDYAFDGCTSLTSITIPSSVTNIGEDAFEYCSDLTSITIPSSVTNIGEDAFYGCTSLTSITVDARNSEYDSRDNCNAIIETSSNTLIAGCMNSTIPYSVTSIGESAFRGCSSLTSITIPSSVTNIGEYAFSYCSGLISVTIPNSVTSIGHNAFSGCSGLISVTIPNSVTSIGHNAFSYCSGLMSVIIPNSLKSIEYSAFERCSSLTSIEIPNSVTSIDNAAFSGCTSLTSITIGNSVTSIGINAFSSCSSLTSITVDAGNSVYDSRENCNAIIETSSNTLVVGCKKSTIPNSVTGIGRDAFSGCSGLTSIILPNHVTRIGSSAFHSCSSLADIYALRSDPSQYGCDTWAFYGFNTSTCTLHVPTGCKEAYASTEPWSYFTNIVEEVLSGIKEMEMKIQDIDAYYNLNGQRITQLQRGINIVRYKDGTSRKMLVK